MLQNENLRIILHQWGVTPHCHIATHQYSAPSFAGISPLKWRFLPSQELRTGEFIWVCLSQDNRVKKLMVLVFRTSYLSPFFFWSIAIACYFCSHMQHTFRLKKLEQQKAEEGFVIKLKNMHPRADKNRRRCYNKRDGSNQALQLPIHTSRWCRWHLMHFLCLQSRRQR